jgi:hypothetical protein
MKLKLTLVTNTRFSKSIQSHFPLDYRVIFLKAGTVIRINKSMSFS